VIDGMVTTECTDGGGVIVQAASIMAATSATTRGRATRGRGREHMGGAGMEKRRRVTIKK
jgi:hypothetical protein